MSSAIEINGLRKVYGATVALDDVTLSVPEGSVFGFLGPNGAGKTTTLRILLGLARATAGSATVLGLPAAQTTRQIGFTPDVPGFYGWMTAPEWLAFTAAAHGIPEHQRAERIEALLDLAGLTGVKQRIGGYSRGMRQRLGIAQGLIHAPRVLLLDEPTSALDPLGRKAVLELVAGLRGRTTVFFSTHILGDVERVCDTVAILDKGRVVTQDTVAALKGRYATTNRLQVEVTDGGGALVAWLAEEAWVESVVLPEPDVLEITARDVVAAQRRLPAMVTQLGVGLVRLDAADTSLEDVFVALVGEGVAP